MDTCKCKSLHTERAVFTKGFKSNLECRSVPLNVDWFYKRPVLDVIIYMQNKSKQKNICNTVEQVGFGSC